MADFKADQDHRITIAEATEFTRNYRNSETFVGKYCGFFGADAIKAILAQKDCVGFRYYYGLDGQSNQVLILVGVTADGTDLTAGELAEVSVPCPPHCNDSSPLMG